MTMLPQPRTTHTFAILLTAILIFGGYPIISAPGGAPGVSAVAASNPTLSPDNLPEPPDAEIYYGWQGMRTRLHVVPDRVGVTFAQPPSRADIETLTALAPELRVRPGLDNAELRRGERQRVRTFIYDTEAPIEREERGAALEAIRNQPGVQAANPVLRNRAGRQSLLTDYLYVSFPIEMPEQDILAMFAADGLEIVSERVHENIGRRGYRLRVTQAGRAAAGADAAAIEIANRYHELEYTTAATPSFAPLYNHSAQVDMGNVDMGDSEDTQEGGGGFEPLSGNGGSVSGADGYLHLPNLEHSHPEIDQTAWHLELTKMQQGWDVLVAHLDQQGSSLAEVKRPTVAVLDEGFFFNYKTGDHETLDPEDPQDRPYPDGLNNEPILTREDIADKLDYKGWGSLESMIDDAGYSGGQGDIKGHAAFDPQTFEDVFPENEAHVDPQWINPNVSLDNNSWEFYGSDFYGWDFVGLCPENLGSTSTPAADASNPIPYPDLPHESSSPYGAQYGNHGTGLASIVGGGPAITGGFLDSNYDEASPDITAWTHGIANVPLMPIRFHLALWARGGEHANWTDIYTQGRAADAVTYAVDNGARIIAAPMVFETYDAGLHEAVKDARDEGVLIVVPAGNRNESLDANPIFPPAWPEVVTVGGSHPVDLGDDNAPTIVRSRLGTDGFPGADQYNNNYNSAHSDPSDYGYEAANYGWALDVTAPVSLNGHRQTGILQAMHTPDQYGWWGGTSSSYPQVVGLAALLLMADENFTADDLHYIIRESADDLEYELNPSTSGHQFYHHGFVEQASDGRDRYTGWGQINAEAAMQMATDSNYTSPAPGFIYDDPEEIVQVGPGNGSDAIQKAIGKADAGDIIVVEEGVYDPIDFDNKDVVVRSTDPWDAEVVGNTVIDANGVGSAVTFGGGESARAAIMGFTITGGTGTWFPAPTPYQAGGGVYGGVGRTMARVMYNWIHDNSAGHGGGIALVDGRVEGNWIGMFPATDHELYGGTNDKIYGEPNVVGTFGAGGAIAQSGAFIRKNFVVGNSAGYGGAFFGCGGVIEQNAIYFNSAGFDGGAFYNCSGATIRANLIWKNDAGDYGGGIAAGHSQNSPTVFEHNTVVLNTAGLSGPGAYGISGMDEFSHNIFWDDDDQVNPLTWNTDTPEYSYVDHTNNPGDPDDENIGPFTNDLDPGFETTTFSPTGFIDFYHLADNSPCRDAGKEYGDDNDPDETGLFRDFNDQLSPLGSNADIGMDEYPTPPEYTYWWERWFD